MRKIIELPAADQVISFVYKHGLDLQVKRFMFEVQAHMYNKYSSINFFEVCEHPCWWYNPREPFNPIYKALPNRYIQDGNFSIIIKSIENRLIISHSIHGIKEYKFIVK